MPSLGFGEILVILVLALLIFGPRRLPEMGKTIGRSLREFRKAASDLRSEIQQDLDEDDTVPRKPSPAERRRQIEARKAAARSAEAEPAGTAEADEVEAAGAPRPDPSQGDGPPAD